MNQEKIPKIIHYCWFGGKEKPKKVKQCIESWHKYLDGYEFMEWNEKNFDVNCNCYVAQAYKEKKYAYVSDYARIKALYEYGGIYMDTDVEVLKSYDDILNNNCILGFEEENYIATSFMAVTPNHKLIKEFIDRYENLQFYNESGDLDLTTNVQRLTSILENKGLVRNGLYQVIENDINIYPQEYFSPYDYGNCIYNNTENTYCIHHFIVSWLPWTIKVKKVIKKFIIPIIGKNNMNKIRSMLKNNT